MSKELFDKTKVTGKQTNSVYIKSYSEEDRELWNCFVEESKMSTFFHQIEWKDAVEKAFRHKAHYVMAFKDNKVTGVMPMFELKSKLFGHSLISVPFGVYGGVCSVDSETERALYRSAEHLGKSIDVDYIEMRNKVGPLYQFNSDSSGHLDEPRKHNEHSNFDGQNWLKNNSFVTFQREIYSDIESNFKAIPRKQRRMIRQGIEAGLVAKIERKENLERFYDLYAIGIRNIGSLVLPLNFFENIMDTFPKTFILSVWKEQKMVAAVMTFVFKDYIMPYYSGALKEYRHCAVNDFMYWELMQYGCIHGYKIFDFGRSAKGTGPYNFKRHWGFEPEALSYMHYLVSIKEVPNLSTNNPKYKALVNVLRRLPLSVTKWLGSKITKNIPY